MQIMHEHNSIKADQCRHNRGPMAMNQVSIIMNIIGSLLERNRAWLSGIGA